MTVLLKTRCKKGHLTITDNEVSIGYSLLGSTNEASLQYNKIASVEIKTTMAAVPILCVGYATVKVFSAGEQVLIAEMVKLKDAQEAEKIINSLLK